MTCIVGLVHENKVYIGGDSAATAGYNLTIRKDTKVFKVDEFVIGFTTSFRMGQLLQYTFKPKKISSKQDLMEYMVNVFVDDVRKCFKSGGYAKKSNEEEEGGTFLVGVQNRLFKIYRDYQVEEVISGINACGCGEEFAMGSLYTTAKLNMNPEERIKLSLEIASYCNAGVRAPFHIISTGE